MTKRIEQRLRIIKLLILIRYIHEFQKVLVAEQPELATNEVIQHDFKKAPRLLALGFEAGEDRVRTMDKNGNTTQKGSWTYTYDYKNKIVKATNGSKTISFEYDPFGRRISKSTGSNTINYYYAGDQVIEERDGSDKLLKQYIYGNLIDEVLRMDKYNNNNQIENSFYYHTDSIGNVTAITDKDGNIVERYKYNIYGSPTITDNTGNILSESAIGNDYLFQSRRYDPELNLYYYRARTYDPEIGRFLQTDPIGYKDSMNLYQAMNMNPWSFVDPWGLKIWCIPWFPKIKNSNFYPDKNKGVSYEANFIIMQFTVFCNFVKLQKGTRVRQVQKRWLCFNNNSLTYNFFILKGKWHEESLRWVKKERITVKGFGWANPNDPTKIGYACCNNPWTGKTVCTKIR